MEATYIGRFTGTWYASSDPDSSVHTSTGVYADLGDIFYNTSSQKLFLCIKTGTQSWVQSDPTAQINAAIAAIPQANWTQNNSGSSDYIKNKPTIPAAQIQSDWNQANISALDYIKNKPSISSRTQSSASRSLNSVFQISSTRDCLVNYSVDIGTSLSLTTGQTGTVYLEIASDSAFTNNVQELSRFLNGNGGTLTIGLALTQNVTGTLSGYVPLGYYVRLRTQNNTSTPTFTYRSGQEILL